MAKQTRTVSHAQWVKFRFEWIHPQNGMSSHRTGAQEKFWGKVRRGVDGEGGGEFSSTPGTHSHSHTHSKAQVATNANNLQVANVGGKRQQQIQQHPTSAETQKGQNKNGKSVQKNKGKHTQNKRQTSTRQNVVNKKKYNKLGRIAWGTRA